MFQMRLNWKILRLAAVPALMLLGAGCAGLNASQSFSPATFFLPGLLKADPPPAQQPDRTLPAIQPQTLIAQS
jgi:hypothetical protein